MCLLFKSPVASDLIEFTKSSVVAMYYFIQKACLLNHTWGSNLRKEHFTFGWCDLSQSLVEILQEALSNLTFVLGQSRGGCFTTSVLKLLETSIPMCHPSKWGYIIIILASQNDTFFDGRRI